MIKIFIKDEWGGTLLLGTVLKMSNWFLYGCSGEKSKIIFFLTLWLLKSRFSIVIGNCLSFQVPTYIHIRLNFLKEYFLHLL